MQAHKWILMKQAGKYSECLHYSYWNITEDRSRRRRRSLYGLFHYNNLLFWVKMRHIRYGSSSSRARVFWTPFCLLFLGSFSFLVVWFLCAMCTVYIHTWKVYIRINFGWPKTSPKNREKKRNETRRHRLLLFITCVFPHISDKCLSFHFERRMA